MEVNAINVIVAMGNTINAEASIRQQKLSILSHGGKKGGDSRNHRPLFNEDKKCKTWLDDGTSWPKIKDVFRVKNRVFSVRKNNVKKVVEMSLQVNRSGAYCFHDERQQQIKRTKLNCQTSWHNRQKLGYLCRH